MSSRRSPQRVGKMAVRNLLLGIWARSPASPRCVGENRREPLSQIMAAWRHMKGATKIHFTQTRNCSLIFTCVHHTWKVFTANYPREKCRLRGFITYLRVVQITHWTLEITGKSQIGVLGSQMDSCYSSEYKPFSAIAHPEHWEHVQTPRQCESKIGRGSFVWF